MSALAYAVQHTHIPLSDAPRERRLPQFRSFATPAPAEYDFEPTFGTVVNLHGSGGWDIAKTSFGHQFALERDPDNEHDANAVSVIATCDWGPQRIGFLDRDSAQLVAVKLDLGYPLVAFAHDRPWAGPGSKGGSMALEIRLQP
jgi:hypothetical protein